MQPGAVGKRPWPFDSKPAGPRVANRAGRFAANRPGPRRGKWPGAAGRVQRLFNANSTQLQRSCVQKRQTCSAGNRPVRVKARSPVARMAERREIEDLKPIDKAIEGWGASHRAVTKVNAVVASKNCLHPRPSPRSLGEGSMARRQPGRRDETLGRGGKRQHGDKDTSSNWRSPPSPEEKSAEKGRPYNRRPREIGPRLKGDGWVRSSEEAG